LALVNASQEVMFRVSMMVPRAMEQSFVTRAQMPVLLKDLRALIQLVSPAQNATMVSTAMDRRPVTLALVNACQEMMFRVLMMVLIWVRMINKGGLTLQ
jgi:hypothetical protein